MCLLFDQTAIRLSIFGNQNVPNYVSCVYSVTIKFSEVLIKMLINIDVFRFLNFMENIDTRHTEVQVLSKQIIPPYMFLI